MQSHFVFFFFKPSTKKTDAPKDIRMKIFEKMV